MAKTVTDPVLHPVILCGGSGTRLWPESRPTKPKPFLPLVDDASLFEQTVSRVTDDPRFANPMIVAGADHASLVEAQMHGAPHRLVVEPAAKGTAPAIALAAALLESDDLMLICPSDHFISDAVAFRDAALRAATLARKDYLVALAVAPDRPATGFGYIQSGRSLHGGFAARSFVEKPKRERAEALLASGDYFWNAGIFAFRAGALMEEIAMHRPQIASAVKRAVAAGRFDGHRIYPETEPFWEIEGESIDYAVMENTSRAALVPVDMGWSDIGSWSALHDALLELEAAGDSAGNAAKGRVDFAQCRNVLARTDGPRISVVGLEDVCIVVADGEVLVTSRRHAEAVGGLPGAQEG